MTLREKYEMMISLGKDIQICCDMDGVLAKWEVGCTYEKTWTPHYFLHRDLQENVRDALLLLLEAGFKCCALSAAYEEGTAREDKRNWLNNSGLANLDDLFVPCGRNKADFIDAKNGATYLLLDDYNTNVIAWSATKKNNANFIAVKFHNGINGNSGNWDGRVIHHHSSAEIIAHTLVDFALMS